MGRLDGKVCVITGAGGGMGRDAAILFTEEGARVCAADVSAEAAEQTVELCSGHAFAQQVDVADEAQVEALMAAAAERFGGIDVLYNNAGISPANVASFVAVLGAATSQISYTASKGAVLSLSRELAVQFARQGVRVNALCPGPVETPLLLRLFNEDPGAYQRRRVHLPMGRLAKAREIANAALFLASDESSYVNGATFLVDGGITAAYVTPE